MMLKQVSMHYRRTGFSLLELMIVLIVMVGLLAIVWPNLQRPLRRSNLSEAAQTLREAIDDSRHRAVMEGSPVFVQLHQGTNQVQTGTLSSFTESDDPAIKTTFESKSLESSLVTPSLSKQDAQHEESHTISWKLPEDIVVLSVRWETEDESFEEDSLTESTHHSNGGTTSNQEFKTANHGHSTSEGHPSTFDSSASNSELSNDHTWWLPLTSQGQGRDASIVLLDTKIQEEITVVYSSATGALEIVR